VLAVDVLSDVVGGTPSEEWTAKIAGKYPDGAARLGVGAVAEHLLSHQARLQTQ
jgi:hypothetical protein